MATKTKPQPKVEETKTNPVVARRLAFLPDNKREDATERFTGGTSIAKIAEEFGVSPTHAAYAVRQHAVESGLVPRIKPEADAIKAAIADDDDPNTDTAWLACRTGLSGGKVKNLVG